MLTKFLILILLFMVNRYTFIFEIGSRDIKSGKLLPYEYRKKVQMSINDARVYVRRLSNIRNVVHVRFYKELY